MPKKTSDFPSVLSFQRALEISDARLRATSSNDRSIDKAVRIYAQGKRTTASYESSKKPGEQRKGDDSRNLAYGEDAKLPPDCDVLTICFAVRLTGIRQAPDACDSSEYFNRLPENIEQLTESKALEDVARYIAYNLMSASWAWRNRDVSDGVRVTVELPDGQTRTVDDALELPAHPTSYDGQHPADALGGDHATMLADIAGHVKRGLETLEGAAPTLKVRGEFQMFPGQAVWPSQLYIPRRKNEKRELSREFFRLDEDAAMTAEKIGNALRTYDVWHASPEYPTAVIPVEPNGGWLRTGLNLRVAARNNRFYDYLPRLKDGDAFDHEESVYILGCLTRGGVFGSADAGDA